MPMVNNSNISGVLSSLIERILSFKDGQHPITAAQLTELGPSDSELSIELFSFLYEKVFELLGNEKVLQGLDAESLYSFLEKGSVSEFVLDKTALSKGFWFLPRTERKEDLLRLLYSLLSRDSSNDGGKAGLTSNHRRLLLGFMEMVLALRMYATSLAKDGILFSLIPFVLDGRPFLVSMRFYGKRTRFYREKKQQRFVCEFSTNVFGVVMLVLDKDEVRDFIWIDLYAQRNLGLLKEDREEIDALRKDINAVIRMRPLNFKDDGGTMILNRKA